MKKYQKLIALAVVLVIAISVTVLVVYLNSIEKNTNFKLGSYTVISQGAGVAIVSFDDEEATEVTIPAKIEGKKIVAIKKGALNDSKVTKVSFEEGSNIEIEEGAFANDTVLQQVTLPSNITYIPKNCFMGCTSLNTVTMPDTITYIGDYAFAECTNLTKNYEKDEKGYRWLELPKSLKEVCDHAFYNCTQLDCIRVSEKLELIDNSAFRSTAIQRIEMYEEDATLAIQEIGDYAFYGTVLCSKSASDALELPALKKIGKYAFASTQANFIYFSVPSGVTSIGDYAFSGSSSLKQIIFESDEGDEELTFGKYALSSCINLESVELKRKVTAIPEGMFMGCIRLLYKQNLTLPEEVSSIGPAAFALFVTPSSNTKYCNYTINFRREGYDSAVNYNDNFKVTQLTDYYASSSTSLTSKHFVITEYYGSDIQGHQKPQSLYAYVGLYSTNSQWKLDNQTSYAFRFLTESSTFSELTTITNSAFAGAMFDKLCLPGTACNIEKNAFYKSSINTIYIDNGCLNVTSNINSEAFANMNTDLKDVRVFVKGTPSQRSSYENSTIKKQIDAINEELCSFTTQDWPK